MLQEVWLCFGILEWCRIRQIQKVLYSLSIRFKMDDLNYLWLAAV